MLTVVEAVKAGDEEPLLKRRRVASGGTGNGSAGSNSGSAGTGRGSSIAGKVAGAAPAAGQPLVRSRSGTLPEGSCLQSCSDNALNTVTLQSE